MGCLDDLDPLALLTERQIAVVLVFTTNSEGRCSGFLVVHTLEEVEIFVGYSPTHRWSVGEAGAARLGSRRRHREIRGGIDCGRSSFRTCKKG